MVIQGVIVVTVLLTVYFVGVFARDAWRMHMAYRRFKRAARSVKSPAIPARYIKKDGALSE